MIYKVKKEVSNAEVDEVGTQSTSAAPSGTTRDQSGVREVWSFDSFSDPDREPPDLQIVRSESNGKSESKPLYRKPYLEIPKKKANEPLCVGADGVKRPWDAYKVCDVAWRIQSQDESDFGREVFCCDAHILIALMMFNKMAIECLKRKVRRVPR